MRKRFARYFVSAAFGLGLCSGMALTAQAQDYHYVPQAPIYIKPNCPTPGPIYTPGPGPIITPIPAPGTVVPTRPTTPAAPGTTPAAPGTTPAAPGTTPAAPGTTPMPSSTVPGANDAAASAAAAPETPSTGETAQSSAQASEAPIMGRGDASNRFNIFDTMSAIPANRVWFNWQYQEGFQTGVQQSSISPSSSFPGDINSAFANRRNEYLYRAGAELAFGKRVSLSMQDQYIASTDTTNAADAWGNPEFLLKFAAVYTEATVISATLGLQPQTASHQGELHEKTTMIYPGVLIYQTLGNKAFIQSGMQFGFSDRSSTNTFDYAISAGYWLYRADCSDGNSRFLTGIIPQVEFFGKHVIANSHRNPFDFSDVPGAGSTVPFFEERNVFDVTAGGRFLFGKGVSFGAGVSFPISGPDVRRTELITSLNITF
jgi:hypothetical protein